MAETPDAAPQFQFTGFAVNRALFEHVERVVPAAGESKPQQVNQKLTVGASITNFGERNAEIRLGLTVIPDPKWLPYKVEVEVLGRFALINGTPEVFSQFCRLTAPPILFPYIREVVHRLTMDGRYGPVRLDPINVQGLLNSSEWQTVPVPQQTTTIANEP